MTISKNLSHAAQALARLLSQFKRDGNWKKLLDIIGGRAQSVENAAWELIDERTLDAAVGTQLDGIGDILGELRLGRDDDRYRIALRARILINKSSGTPEQLYEIFVTLFSSNTFEIVELEPAAFTVESGGALTTDEAEELARVLSEARAAGIGAQLIYSEDDDASSFILSDTTEDTSTTQGLTDTDEDAADGGSLAGVLES